MRLESQRASCTAARLLSTRSRRSRRAVPLPRFALTGPALRRARLLVLRLRPEHHGAARGGSQLVAVDLERRLRHVLLRPGVDNGDRALVGYSPDPEGLLPV